ncbi:hypothetical protein [uncultured Alsobacter sp.]|uniref:hypothetical protein n=1 Tax=uncultured Alsobacter sp. TaxID=1748258 RepID=UPI0025D520FB|nr:hypothetical protein [uncultured Alsobacter sp.]
MSTRWIAALLALAVLVPATAKAAPRYKLDRDRQRVVEITNLGGATGCLPAKVAGTVVSQETDPRGLLSGVTVEEADGTESYANVHELPAAQMSAADLKWIRQGLDQLLAKGARVDLQVGACGASGSVLVIKSIRPLR